MTLPGTQWTKSSTAFLLIVIAAVASPVPAPEAFSRLCAPCHGADGKGGERAPAAAAEHATTPKLQI
ncbi:MAG TPA: hypothetical protein VE621_17740 [Bryobacteraceae bacterium]|nr:hypothetical protein [Bryobacteraceae bacterium]